MHTPVPCSELEALLPRFIRGDHEVAIEFDRIARPLLMTYANRLGWLLALDQREEIVQQAFLLLVGSAGRAFDPSRKSVQVFLWLITRRATREVGAMYTMPGSRTRPPKRDESKVAESPMARVVSLENLEEHEVPPVKDSAKIVDLRHDVAAILAMAPVGVACALSRIHLEEVPMGVVAAEMGTSRFALGRAINKFVETFVT